MTKPVAVLLAVVGLVLPGCQGVRSTSRRPEVAGAAAGPDAGAQVRASVETLLMQVDDVVRENPLPPEKASHAVKIGGNQHVTILVVQARQMPAHYHVAHDETVYVRSGSGQLLLGTKEYRVTPGVLMHIPRGTVHRYVGDTVEPAVVVSILSPAMTGADFVVVPSRDAPAEVKRP